MDASTSRTSRMKLPLGTLRNKVELIGTLTGEDSKEKDDEYDGDFIQETSDEQETTYEDDRSKDRFKSNKSYEKILTFKYPSSMTGKNGFKWEEKPINEQIEKTKQIYASNIFDEAIKAKGAIEIWSLLFTDEIIIKIVEYTNEEIIQKSKFLSQELTNYKKTDIEEIKLMIALFYLRGLYKVTSFKNKILWTKGFACIHFHSIPLKRFEFLEKCLRFNNITKRNEKEDPLTAIQEIWNIFISNCQRYYLPSQNCRIDEELLGFYDECPFLVRMDNKPDKQGLKVVMMNDAETGYMINAVLYTGIDSEALESKPDFLVKKVSEPIHGSERTIIVDNWFMSMSLMQTMLTQYSLTMVGCIKKSEPEVPSIFTKVYPEKTALFAYDKNNNMLISYTPEIGKIILILSSSTEKSYLNQTTSMPTVLFNYHVAKKEMELFNSTCRSFSVATQTTYWPLRLFYAMLDQACLNSHILYNINKNHDSVSYKDFMWSLLESLLRPFYKIQVNNLNIRRCLRACMGQIISVKAPKAEIHKEEKLNPKQYCHNCECNKKLTDTVCHFCGIPICDDHQDAFCYECI